MTPEIDQAPPGYFRRPRSSPGEMTPVRLSPGDVPSIGRDARAPVRSGESVRSLPLEAQAARTGPRDTAPWGPPAFPPPPPAAPAPAAAAAAKRAREDGSIVAVLPYLAILTCTIAGVYVAWHQGSAGAGRGGVVSGAALLVAAFLRLVLPARLVGLLGTRKRAIDVLTLAVFGGGLLVAGLVLPR